MLLQGLGVGVQRVDTPVRVGRLRGSMARLRRMLAAQQVWVKAHPDPNWGANTPSSRSHHHPYSRLQTAAILVVHTPYSADKNVRNLASCSVKRGAHAQICILQGHGIEVKAAL